MTCPESIPAGLKHFSALTVLPDNWNEMLDFVADITQPAMDGLTYE